VSDVDEGNTGVVEEVAEVGTVASNLTTSAAKPRPKSAMAGAARPARRGASSTARNKSSNSGAAAADEHSDEQQLESQRPKAPPEGPKVWLE
jgi:hypothetical protein